MRFTDSNASFVDDGQGGRFLEGTFELTILEGTGIYKPFAGGHNHMVDKLHFLAPGDGSGGVDEYCFCFISRQSTTSCVSNYRVAFIPDYLSSDSTLGQTSVNLARRRALAWTHGSGPSVLALVEPVFSRTA
jgi:hypothetical protein